MTPAAFLGLCFTACSTDLRPRIRGWTGGCRDTWRGPHRAGSDGADVDRRRRVRRQPSRCVRAVSITRAELSGSKLPVEVEERRRTRRSPSTAGTLRPRPTARAASASSTPASPRRRAASSWRSRAITRPRRRCRPASPSRPVDARDIPGHTSNVTNVQSAIILGTAAGTARHAVITVWDPFHFSNGSLAVLPGGNGSGRVISQPAGIDCTITRGNGTATCDAFFPVGTVVRIGPPRGFCHTPGLLANWGSLAGNEIERLLPLFAVAVAVVTVAPKSVAHAAHRFDQVAPELPAQTAHVEPRPPHAPRSTTNARVRSPRAL